MQPPPLSRSLHSFSVRHRPASLAPALVLGLALVPALLGGAACAFEFEVALSATEGLTTGSTGDPGETAGMTTTATATTTGGDPTTTGDDSTTTGDGPSTSATAGPTTTTGDDSTTTDGDDPPEAPELYLGDRTQSPITPYVAANLLEIAERGTRRGDVFAKIGASATATVHFMACFADDTKTDLFGRDHLWDTVHTFRAEVAGTTSFDRKSLSATPGWSAVTAVGGDPSPLQQELDASGARFAVVMYGTNDINLGSVHNYGRAMTRLVETAIDQGVIPLLTTVMPRDDNPDADAQVSLYNAVVRAIAQAHQVPLIDFHRELEVLDDHGLGGDGIHRSVYKDGGLLRACVLNPEGLEFGANIRNLITLQALDRARLAVDGAAPFDPPTHQLAGAGQVDDPFAIRHFPFGDRRDTASDGVPLIDVYPGCDAPQDESGPEVYYRVELDAPATLRAVVIDRGEVDIDIHLVDATATGEGCIARADRTLITTVEPGVYYYVLDTFISGEQATAGEYLFVVERLPVGG